MGHMTGQLHVGLISAPAVPLSGLSSYHLLVWPNLDDISAALSLSFFGSSTTVSASSLISLLAIIYSSLFIFTKTAMTLYCLQTIRLMVLKDLANYGMPITSQQRALTNAINYICVARHWKKAEFYNSRSRWQESLKSGKILPKAGRLAAMQQFILKKHVSIKIRLKLDIKYTLLTYH